MVTNTKTNVKTNVKSNRTKYDWDYLPHVHLLERNKPNNGKWKCPNCGGNDFDFNKDGSGFTCYSGCQDSVKVNEAFKKLAGLWVENDNNSFTSVSNKPAVTIESKPLLKVKSARPRDYQEYHLRHDVLDSDGQVIWVARYENHVKLKGHQYFLHPDGTQSKSDITTLAGGSDKILPFTYLHGGFKHLIDVENPFKLLIVEGELTAVACDRKLGKHILAIAPYNGSNKNLIPSLVEQLKLITNLKEIVLSPDFDKKGFEYMFALSKELKKAGYDVEWLFPYSNHPDWNNVSKSSSEGVDMTDYLEQYKNLSAEQIINQIRVISDDELERMLTGKTVTASNAKTTSTGNINLDSWTENVKEIILQSQASDNYLVEGLFTLGKSILIGAKAGLGKSTMMTQLSISIALGLPFMGRKVNQGKVIYCTSDEDFTTTTDRLVTQGILQNEDDFYNNFILLGRNKDTGKNWSVDNLEVLREFFKVHQPTVFILDSLTTAIASPAGIDVNKPEIADAIEKIINLCRESGVTFLLLHHLRKDSDNDDNCYAGNHQIPARFDATWKLERVTGNDDARVFKSTKDRDRQCTKYDLDFNPDTRSFSIDDSTEDDLLTAIIPTEPDDNILTEKEKMILDLLAKGQQLTVKEIMKVIGLAEKTTYRQLTKLVDQNVIVKVNDINPETKRKITKYSLSDNSNNDNYKTESSHSKGCGVVTINDNSSYNNDNSKSDNDNYNLVQSEDTINVQSEVIDNCPTSDKQDIVDTEKESKQDTIAHDGKVFKTGDCYWTTKAKILLVKIARFTKDREGVMGIGPRCEINKATGEIIPIVDSEYGVCLDGDVYPYEG